jgi:hypothetical protein
MKLTGYALSRALRADAENCVNSCRQKLLEDAAAEIEQLISELRSMAKRKDLRSDQRRRVDERRELLQ